VTKITLAATAFVLATALMAVPASADPGVTLSAKRKVVKARPQGQIACTVAGCHRIPANCHPTMGYTWDGIPSGFDVVICRRRR
jgi:hypothetical protein